MTDTQLRIALERITQAAEQYLDTEHRDGARDLELRRKLGEATTDAALLLTECWHGNTCPGGGPECERAR